MIAWHLRQSLRDLDAVEALLPISVRLFEAGSLSHPCYISINLTDTQSKTPTDCAGLGLRIDRQSNAQKSVRLLQNMTRRLSSVLMVLTVTVAAAVIVRAEVKLQHDAVVLNSKGVSLAETGRHQEAIEAFKLALHIDPEFASAYYNLGCEYISGQGNRRKRGQSGQKLISASIIQPILLCHR